jgi:transposase
MVSLPDPLPDQYDDLRRVTLALAAEVKEKAFLIEALKFELARLKRARFGALNRPEKLGGHLI